MTLRAMASNGKELGAKHEYTVAIHSVHSSSEFPLRIWIPMKSSVDVAGWPERFAWNSTYFPWSWPGFGWCIVLFNRVYCFEAGDQWNRGFPSYAVYWFNVKAYQHFLARSAGYVDQSRYPGTWVELGRQRDYHNIHIYIYILAKSRFYTKTNRYALVGLKQGTYK